MLSGIYYQSYYHYQAILVIQWHKSTFYFTKFQPSHCFLINQVIDFRQTFRFLCQFVNSDAHYPERINNGRAEALAALKKAGFTSVAEWHNGKWEEREIE
jgi:predicted small integral membrane protein